MKYIVLLGVIYSVALFGKTDDASFFDINGTCNKTPVDVSQITQATVDNTLQGILGILPPVSNVNRYNVGAQQY